ncbi:MAG: DegT/DnrJ/EryC1/StrS family aminotransferase, partial [Myxococcota bacterium]|nr:DegT/DnrJ/EryC1/StrS family aminotransferase [Myxococcota bacterium]
GGAATALGETPVALDAVEMAPWPGHPDAPAGRLALDATGARVRCGSGALRVLAARSGGLALDRNGFARFCAALREAERLGPPRRSLLPFGVPEIGREEEEAVLRTLRSRWIGTGPTVAALERDFCEATGARHAVAVSSCTAALHLALLGAGVGPGDEVVTTALTFVATVNAILYTGARPVLVDVEPDTLNLDPARLEAAITPRTRAVVPVHFGGRPCDMARIRRIAARRGVAVVEDAAHAVGARHPSGRAVGSGPAEACFSFYPNKNLTTCEGGMVTTRSAERAERYVRMRMHGLTADAWKRFGSEEIVRSRMVEMGFKYNLTDLQAALGRVQLGRLESWTAVRGEQAALYREAFAGLRRVRPLPAWVEGRGRHAYHLFTVRIEGMPRDQAQVELRRRGVGAAIHYEPVHLHPFYRARLGLAPGAFPVAEEAGARTLTLPIGPSLRRDDLRRVVEAVRALESVPAATAQPPRAGTPAPRRVSKRAWSPRPTTSPGG